MKIKIVISVFLSILIFTSCKEQVDVNKKEQFKAEVIKAEEDFAKIVKEQGITAGFLAFADENAVLKRGEQLIKGKAEIQAHLEAQGANYKEVNLEWKADFVEVSESGDLAYTYGHANFSAITVDSTEVEGTVVFHTVWKRQADGSWKYVWD
ncbi:YybH family protein [Bacteroidota bacterium]